MDARAIITRLRDGLKLFVDNPGKLEAAVENNRREAMEMVRNDMITLWFSIFLRT